MDGMGVTSDAVEQEGLGVVPRGRCATGETSNFTQEVLDIFVVLALLYLRGQNSIGFIFGPAIVFQHTSMNGKF